MTNIAHSLTDLIGNTPLLELTNYNKKFAPKATIIAKLEYFNPAGSAKDRIAMAMIDAAEAQGILQKDSVIIEPTSGNTGIGLASVASARGYRTILTMPETMSVERRNLLKALGASVVLTPAAQGMSGAVTEAQRIAAAEDGCILGQFTNPEAVQAHYKTTGPEIFKDSVGHMDALVAGVGSGSSITGTGRFLKEHIKNFRVIAVEPAASPVLSGGKAAPHLIQGIGAGFIPKILDRTLLDEIILADGEEAMRTSRELMKQGVVAGISTGANVRAALSVAARPEMQGKNIVTFACDTGERYMSTRLFTDMQ